MVPFGFLILAPVVVNIIAFHVFLAPVGIPLAIVVLVLELFLAWVHQRVWFLVRVPQLRSALARVETSSTSTDNRPSA